MFLKESIIWIGLDINISLREISLIMLIIYKIKTKMMQKGESRLPSLTWLIKFKDIRPPDDERIQIGGKHYIEDRLKRAY